MPIQEIIDKHRAWCQTCADYVLYTINPRETKEVVCDICTKEHIITPLEQIPRMKILEQRERYKEAKRRHMEEILKLPYRGMLMEMSMFSPWPTPKVNITESDAGQKALDEKAKRDRQKALIEWEEKQNRRKEMQKKFKDVQRNDKCLCGSGKKFKKCCIDETR